MTFWQAMRNDALRKMAEDSIAEYNADCERGIIREPPMWAVHLVELLNEVETLPDRVLH